jgi:hypothetical protein
MRNTVIYVENISKSLPLMVNFYDNPVEINSIRTFRKVVNGNEIYNQTDNTLTPIYEAVWLYTKEGNNILNNEQLTIITEVLKKELNNPNQLPISEDQIVYLET